MRILITGGLGFIGSAMVRWLLTTQPTVEVVNVDCWTYAGHPDNVAPVAASPRYRWERVSVTDAAALEAVLRRTPCDAVLHFAAESHVDRSIADPAAFVDTNVGGTDRLLTASRRFGVERFVQISTDEVYGSLGPDGAFTETDPLAPSSPYAASKAAADLLVGAAHHTYGQNVGITRCSNNYGPYQFPEKFIPRCITRGLTGQPLPLYGDGGQVRDWLYVEDHVEAVWTVLTRGAPGRVYNIGGANEQPNRAVAETLCALLGLPPTTIHSVADRPGHDRRTLAYGDLASRDWRERGTAAFAGSALSRYTADRGSGRRPSECPSRATTTSPLRWVLCRGSRTRRNRFGIGFSSRGRDSDFLPKP